MGEILLIAWADGVVWEPPHRGQFREFLTVFEHVRYKHAALTGLRRLGKRVSINMPSLQD